VLRESYKAERMVIMSILSSLRKGLSFSKDEFGNYTFVLGGKTLARVFPWRFSTKVNMSGKKMYRLRYSDGTYDDCTLFSEIADHVLRHYMGVFSDNIYTHCSGSVEVVVTTRGDDFVRFVVVSTDNGYPECGHDDVLSPRQFSALFSKKVRAAEKRG